MLRKVFGCDFKSIDALEIVKIHEISRIWTDFHLRDEAHREFHQEDPRQQSTKVEKIESIDM